MIVENLLPNSMPVFCPEGKDTSFYARAVIIIGATSLFVFACGGVFT